MRVVSGFPLACVVAPGGEAADVRVGGVRRAGRVKGDSAAGAGAGGAVAVGMVARWRFASGSPRGTDTARWRLVRGGVAGSGGDGGGEVRGRHGAWRRRRRWWEDMARAYASKHVAASMAATRRKAEVAVGAEVRRDIAASTVVGAKSVVDKTMRWARERGLPPCSRQPRRWGGVQASASSASALQSRGAAKAETACRLTTIELVAGTWRRSSAGGAGSEVVVGSGTEVVSMAAPRSATDGAEAVEAKEVEVGAGSGAGGEVGADAAVND